MKHSNWALVLLLAATPFACSRDDRDAEYPDEQLTPASDYRPGDPAPSTQGHPSPSTPVPSTTNQPGQSGSPSPMNAPAPPTESGMPPSSGMNPNDSGDPGKSSR